MKNKIKVRYLTIGEAIKLFVVYNLIVHQVLVFLLSMLSGVAIGVTTMGIQGRISNNVFAIVNLCIGMVASCIVIMLLERSIKKRKSYDRTQCFKVDKGALSVIILLVVVTAFSITGMWWLLQDVMFPNVPEHLWTWPMDMEAIEALLEGMGLIVWMVYACIIGPIIEEWIYRGIFLKGLSKGYSVGIAIVTSSIIFGLAHGNVGQFVTGTLLGIVLGTVYLKYKSIGACILLHCLYNGMVSLPIGDYVHPIFYIVGIVGVSIVIYKLFKSLEVRQEEETEVENFIEKTEQIEQEVTIEIIESIKDGI